MKTLGKILFLVGIISMVGVFAVMLYVFLLRPTSEWSVMGEILPALSVVAVVGLFVGSLLQTAGKKIKNGFTTIGTIVEIHPTGTTINDQPEVVLRVSFLTQSGQSVTATAKTVIILTNLPLFQPGGQIPLSYNPNRPEEISFDVQIDQMNLQDIFNQTRVAQGVTTTESLQIAKDGVEAQGVILWTQPTGKIVNGNAELDIKVKVTKTDGSAYDAALTRPIEQRYLPKLQPGCVVKVFYLPENEQKITIGVSAG